MSKKISELNEMTSIADNSLFAAVDYSGGNGETKKITYEKLKDALGNEISGIMAYKVVTLTQSSLSASGDSVYPYYYTVNWPSAKATDFTDAAIQTGNYDGSYKVTSNAGNVRLDFTDALAEEIMMYVYLQGGEVAEDGSPDDAYYNKPEINTQMGYDGVEQTAVASKSHSTGDFFLWQGTPAKAIADIAQGATIASGTNVEMASVFGELGKILGTRDVQGLRYYVENSNLTASVDNVKSVLEKYATAPYVNLQGVSIVNIRFATAGQVLAILSHYRSGGFAALVYGFSYSYVPAYQLSYSNGVWTDILLASGRVFVSSTEITKVVPTNTYKSIRSVDVTKGLWNFQYMANFNSSNATGARIMMLSTQKDIYSSTYYGGFFGSPTPTVQTIIRSSFIMGIVNPTTIYLTVMQNSGSEINVSGELTAYRLS